MNSLTVIEYQAKRVLTTQQLAAVYETDSKFINNNYNRNQERFIERRDFYKLEGEELKAFKGAHLDDESLKFVSILYLWTERGANRHCKILDSDKAWQQFDLLEETYFKVKSESKPVCIEDAIIASMQQHKMLRLEMEAQKMQLDSHQNTLAIHSAKINQIAAKIQTSPTDYFSIAGYASLRGIKIDVNKANLLGRKAAKYSRDTEIDIGRVNDPRFGQVNTYHLDVLKEIFDTLEVSA